MLSPMQHVYSYSNTGLLRLLRHNMPRSDMICDYRKVAVQKMMEVAVKNAKILSASKRSQILQNGSPLQFNGKVRQRTVLRWSKKTGFR